MLWRLKTKGLKGFRQSLDSLTQTGTKTGDDQDVVKTTLFSASPAFEVVIHGERVEFPTRARL